MTTKFLFRFVPVAGLLVILYLIWPAPFAYFARRIVLPAAQAVGDVARATVSPVRFLGQFKSLSQKNKDLENLNSQLQAEIARAKQENLICQEFKKEASIAQIGTIQTLTAKVAGRTPQIYGQKIIIDQGTLDGAKSGAAVMSNGYLIGRIDKSYDHQAEVFLISNHNSLIPVISEKNRETGLLQGGLEGLSVIDLPSNSKVEVGEKITTSGLGEDLPSGILVGEVEGLIGEKNSLFLSARVTSPVNTASIDVVSVAQ